MNDWLINCRLCPRGCGADRTKQVGLCGGGERARVAKTMLHMWEEPVISGNKGSGAVFFSGCALRCGYCQNGEISRCGAAGEGMNGQRLAETFLQLQKMGAHNINLVTAGHYLPQIAEALRAVKGKLTVPVVYNSSGYERPEAINALDGLVSVFLPDLKYYDSEISLRLSGAADYFKVAVPAIARMVELAGPPVIEDGLIKSGVIIRHLCLPSFRVDSLKIMDYIASRWGGSVLVSVMSQYTPAFNKTGVKALDRKITSFEYGSVVNRAAQLGLKGFMQNRGAATKSYTPDFSGQRDDGLNI